MEEAIVRLQKYRNDMFRSCHELRVLANCVTDQGVRTAINELCDSVTRLLVDVDKMIGLLKDDRVGYAEKKIIADLVSLRRKYPDIRSVARVIRDWLPYFVRTI